MASCSSLAVRAGADQQRQIGHLRDRHAVEDHAFGIDQRELALVLPQRGRLALDDVDHQRVGQAARNPRILDPAEAQQPLADGGDVDQRLRRLGRARLLRSAVKLVVDDLVDARAVEVVEADDLVAADHEAGAADRGPGRAFGLGGNVERDQRDYSDREQEGEEGQAGKPIGARMVDRQPLGDPLGHDLGRRLARLGPVPASAPDVRRAHRNASSISRSTSSPYAMPRSFACSGTRLKGVIPGWVLTSSR